MGRGVKGPTQNPVVIVAAARTPMGAFQGDLAQVSAPELDRKSVV